MKIRVIIFSIGFIILAIVGTISYFYDTNVCDPEWKTIESTLDFIKTPNSIKRIELLKTPDDFDIDLVKNTLTVTDSSTIEDLRKIICNRHTGQWARPTVKWSVILKMTLSNDKSFEFKVSRINNDKNIDMTHIYFGTEHCLDSNPIYSLTLGNFLESLTRKYN